MTRTWLGLRGWPFLRRHGLLLVILLVGVAVRVAVMLAYRPALFFGDSWGYIDVAFSGHTVGAGSPAISNFRPSGYSVLIWLLSAPGRHLVQVVLLQHVAGVLIGALTYAALIRTGLARWIAACASALVLLDAYAIALEQYVMADTFFAVIVLVACLVLAWPSLRASSAEIGWARVTVAGLLIAASTLVRLEGLFLLPVVVGYLLWRRVRWRGLLAFGLAVAVPLLGYAALESADFGTFGLSQWSGWTAYARVASFADCDGAGISREAQPLCETTAQRASHPSAPIWYMFDGASPALKLFGPISRGTASQRHSDAVLAGFALRIVRHQPLKTLWTVSLDFLRFFAPGTSEFGDSTGATALPSTASAEYVDDYVRARFVPTSRPTVHAPSALLRGYRAVVHLPRPVLALLALAGVVAVAMRLRWRREVLLFSGSGLALLAGTAATAGFAQRYVLCAVPLITIGGTLAFEDLAARRRATADAGGPRPRLT